jgi:hypothetical protein
LPFLFLSVYYMNVFTFYKSVSFQILSQAALAAHDCYEPSQPGSQTAYRNTAAAGGGSTVRQPHRLISNSGNSISGAYSAAQNDLCGNSGGSQYSSQHHIYMEVDPLYCSHQADPRYCPQLPHSSTQVELLLSSPGEEEEEEPCCSTPGLVGGASSSNSSQSSSGYSTAPSDTYCYADQLNSSMTAATTSPGRGEAHQQHQQQMGHHQRLVYYQGHPPHHHHPAGGCLVLRPAYAPGQHQHHAPPPPLMPHHHGGGVNAPVGADAGNVVFSISQGCESRGTAPPPLGGGGSTRRKGRTARKSHVGGGATGPRHSSGGSILLSSEHQLIRLDENHVI